MKLRTKNYWLHASVIYEDTIFQNQSVKQLWICIYGENLWEKKKACICLSVFGNFEYLDVSDIWWHLNFRVSRSKTSICFSSQPISYYTTPHTVTYSNPEKQIHNTVECVLFSVAYTLAHSFNLSFLGKAMHKL